MLSIEAVNFDERADRFCKAFLAGATDRRFVFGRNEYARSIAGQVEVSGFVDDFTSEPEYLGKPVIRTEDIPADAMVVSAVTLGRPITVENKLAAENIDHLDYYSFYKYSGLDLEPVTFWKDFPADFERHREKYEWIYSVLADEESKRIFGRLVNFRLSGDLAHMDGFTDRQREQYFEDFLGLKSQGEVFLDVGGFDGFTSLEFIKRCPDYEAVYLFEPDERNMRVAQPRLAGHENIWFVPKGLSDRAGVVRFSIGGSASVISEDGEAEIRIEALDNMKIPKATFIKMDIEGAESGAIDGARKTIAEQHPRLAICVYHKADDLWRIPEQVLSIRNDYSIYLRHYTEGVTETVMFFVPS